MKQAKYTLGYLAIVLGWGLFVFQIPSLIDQYKQWTQVLAAFHKGMLNIADWMSTWMPAAPDRWGALTIWESLIEIFRYWPHVVALAMIGLLSLGTTRLVGYLAVTVTRRAHLARTVLQLWLVTWLAYSFFGQKLLLRSSYSIAEGPVFFEAYFKALSRAPDPTAAYCLMQIYSVVAILGLGVIFLVLLLAQRELQNRLRKPSQ